MFGLIADIWSHGRELSLAILSSLSSWTGSLQRYSDKPPSDWGHLVPPLLVAQHLCSCRLHLCICSGPDTHTHTHTHTNTANTSTCMYTHMFGMGTQMQTGNTGVSGAKDGLIQQCWRWRQSAPCPAFGAPCPPPPQTPPDFPKEA